MNHSLPRITLTVSAAGIAATLIGFAACGYLWIFDSEGTRNLTVEIILDNLVLCELATGILAVSTLIMLPRTAGSSRRMFTTSVLFALLSCFAFFATAFLIVD